MHHQIDERPVAELVAEPRLRERERRVRHRLHTAGDDDVVVACADHLVGDLDRPDARRADLVDRVGRHLDRQPRADRRLPRRRLAGAGLEHLAHDHVLDVGALEPGSLDGSANGDRSELGRRLRRKRAAETPEGRADGGDDHRAAHARRLAAE